MVQRLAEKTITRTLLRLEMESRVLLQGEISLERNERGSPKLAHSVESERTDVMDKLLLAQGARLSAFYAIIIQVIESVAYRLAMSGQ